MFSIGDTVVFGSEGIFTVEDTTQREIGGKKMDYYVLKSKHKDKSTVYLPMNNPDILKRAKPLITKEGIAELLDKLDVTEDVWVDDYRQRKERFNQILQSGSRESIITLAETIYQRQQSQLAHHKKLSSSDERILREAERIIKTEFAFVLDISQDDVGEYIRSRIRTSH